jgi:hypothetical protein
MKKRLFLQGSLLLLSALTITSFSTGNVSKITAETKPQTTTNSNKVNDETAKTYYVATNGSKTGDGSEENPYSIVKLLNSTDILKPGDTVIIKSGTYNLGDDDRIKITASGSFEKNITIKSEGVGTVTLDFSSMKFNSVNRGVTIAGDHITWDGIDVCGAGDNGVYVSGNYNLIANCEFYNNRDSGLQLGRDNSEQSDIADWPSYNLIQNCTSFNNYDNETYGENADGFAAKLTVGYGNVFDSCIAYRNSDDGWDLYAKTDSGDIGCITLYNCVSFENGYLLNTKAENNARFKNYNKAYDETETNSYMTRDGDGIGFKLGGSTMRGDVKMYNCLSFNNRLHGVGDNSNPGVLSIENVTSYNNSAIIDDDPNSANFGNIVLGTLDGDSKSSNIDMARTEDSYNNYKNVLSVKNGGSSLAGDAYRGSAEYSYFDDAAGNAYKFEGYQDASSYVSSKKGTKTTALTASDIFTTLPVTWETNANGETVYSYNITGKNNTLIDANFRNADGSINMHSILEVKDQSKLFGNEHQIGASFLKDSYNDYTHPYAEVKNATDEKDYLLMAARNALYLNTDEEAVYQDFNLLTKIMGCNVAWSSSDPSIIKIGSTYNDSRSNSESVRAIVNRPSEDSDVTLTATLVYYGETITQTFVVHVKAAAPELGEMTVTGLEKSRIIVDQYQAYTLPEVQVEDGSDYNGKLLPTSAYTLKTKIEFATDKNATYHEVAGFTTSKAGVYKITKTATLNSKSSSLTFYVYVASKTANVDFEKDSTGVSSASVIVNKTGYQIEGNLTNVTGSIYALSSKDAISDISADYIKEHGKGYTFRDDTIACSFENDNNEGYHIYYVLTNANGIVTSQVYEKEINTVSITTAEEFKKFAASNESTKIYTLDADIDLSTTTWTGNDYTLKGLLNGKGHKIYNGSIASASNGASLFNKMSGGTIENVVFENLTFTNASGKQRAGIVAQAERGDFYNIQLRNVVSTGGSGRNGALIAQIVEKNGYEVNIDQVSLINDANKVIGGAADCGGIVGMIQATSGSYGTTNISNIYVDATIDAGSSNYAGSIVGRYGDRANETLNINHVYSKAIVKGNTYVGGIIGAHQNSAGTMKVLYCAFTGELYYGSNLERVTGSQKNCSNIVGRYSSVTSLSIVEQCYAPFEEANSNYSVNVYDTNELEKESFYSHNIDLDVKTKWTFDETTKTISLNFIDTWTKA